MTKKLFETMLVCLCLVCTFNIANADTLSEDMLASAAISTEIKTSRSAEVKKIVNNEIKKSIEIKKEKAVEEVKKNIEAAEVTTATNTPTNIAPAVMIQNDTPAATPVVTAQNKSSVSTTAPAKSPVVKKPATVDIKKTIMDVALSLGVDPYVALSIAKLESGFDQRKKNPSGAIGLYQLMPSTAKFLGVNPHIANDNIKGGLLYYKQLYKKFGSMDLALAAYNAGPGNVAKYNGMPPFKETKAFVAKVKQEYNTFKADPLLKTTKSSTL